MHKNVITLTTNIVSAASIRRAYDERYTAVGALRGQSKRSPVGWRVYGASAIGIKSGRLYGSKVRPKRRTDSVADRMIEVEGLTKFWR